MSNTPAKIGLVDDDPSVRRAVDRLLRSHGFFCKTYGSAETALADPDFRNMDCLVLDLQLPGMSGIELRDQLLSSGPAIPCVFITAHPSYSRGEPTEDINQGSFLTKPFEERLLISSIQRVMQKV